MIDRIGAALVLTALGAPLPGRAEPGQEVPQVRALQRAALRFAGAREERWRSLRYRLRFAPLLPQVSAMAGKGLDFTYSGRVVDGVPDGSSRDGERWNYAVTARWDLSRLIFDREELAVAAQEQRAARLGTAAAAEVARVYYQRQRLLDAPGAMDRRRLLHIAELTATLEALTGLSGLAAPAPDLDGPGGPPAGAHTGPAPAGPQGPADPGDLPDDP